LRHDHALQVCGNCIATFTRHRVIGIEADRLIEVGKRLLIMLEVRSGDAAIVVRIRVSRIETDRLGVVGNGPLILFELPIGICAIVVRSREVGLEPDRLARVLRSNRRDSGTHPQSQG